jgi:hypothetical protein
MGLKSGLPLYEGPQKTRISNGTTQVSLTTKNLLFADIIIFGLALIA